MESSLEESTDDGQSSRASHMLIILALCAGFTPSALNIAAAFSHRAKPRVLVSALDTTPAVGDVSVVVGLLACFGPPVFAKSQQFLTARTPVEKNTLMKAQDSVQSSQTRLGLQSGTLISAIIFEMYFLDSGDVVSGAVCAVIVSTAGALTGAAASKLNLSEIALRNSMVRQMRRLPCLLSAPLAPLGSSTLQGRGHPRRASYFGCASDASS